ncbi:MAG: NYN domain-containing protein [Erysipelotrichaceae bacterium]|nr:NYN domain-containing protein [Erysipelotrichaceae bacterium]
MNEGQKKRYLSVGIVAHVDAGKTTCIEAMLYEAGRIRKAGRVDHRDTVLDYDEQERAHGITIYAKDAWLDWQNERVFVIDTPGHVDFSAEMERSLSVVDLAVIVINGQDGVQSHTKTIWKCLEYYGVPAIIFVNKMDIAHHTKEELLKDLQKECSDMCIDWQADSRDENAAMASEDLMNAYLSDGHLSSSLLQDAFTRRQFFPVLFGSALHQEGIHELLDTIVSLPMEKQYPDTFGARVYAVSTDPKGERLCHVRVTGGVLSAKVNVSQDEKVDQIRLYTGQNYEMVQDAYPGMICTLKGLNAIEAGAGLGFEQDLARPLLNAFMDYKLILPQGADVLALRDVCSQLAAEDPTLQVDLDADHHSIHVRIMGAMQMEVLQKKIFARSGIQVGFGHGGIVYHETIADKVIGVGHFEPLRHYAEAVVQLEPLPLGSGVQVESRVPAGMLSGMFERALLSALRHEHRGVLTGSPLDDVRIVLIAGKGSLKHTSGGDMRQAARRAVRQGLMKAESILLEPYEDFQISVPSSSLSRVLFDLETRECTFSIAEDNGDTSVITGKGPVRTMMDYQKDLTANTHGLGRLYASVSGYEKVKNQDAVIAEKNYDPDSDLRNPTGSVFCANGAGYFVPWTDVEKHMHIDLHQEGSSAGYRHETIKVAEQDLSRILANAAGNNRNLKKKEAPVKKKDDERTHVDIRPASLKERRMIIDGYNCLYSWKSMEPYQHGDLSVAREKLIDIIYAWQAYYKAPIVLVFDGYKRKDNAGSVENRRGMTIVYTRTDQTADAWIEKTIAGLKGKYDMTVVTSDGLIQNAVLAAGAKRMSSRELEGEIVR